MIYRHATCILFLLTIVSALPTKAQTPAEAAAAYNHGIECYKHEDLSCALRSFTRAIDAALHTDSSSNARSKRAQLSLTTTEAPDSEITFIDPVTALAYGNRGMVRFRLGDFEGAIADTERAVKINPGLVLAYRNLGVFHWKHGDTNQALSNFSEVIKRSPQEAMAYNCRGNIYFELGDLIKALVDLDQAIRLDPNVAQFYCDRGEVLMANGELDKARLDFQQALKIDPQSSRGHACLGTAAYKQKDFEQALAELNRAIELDRGWALPYGIRGLTHIRLGHKAEADQDFAECLRLNPALKPNLELSLRNENWVMPKL